MKVSRLAMTIAASLLLASHATPAQAQVFFFTTSEDFEAAIEDAGMVLKGFEEFPWLAPRFAAIEIDDPLDVNTSVPGWIKPGVLLDNVTYQSNLDPFGTNGPNPRGTTGLALFTSAFFQATHNGVVATHFVDSFDIRSGVPEPANHTAMALQLVSLNTSPAGSSITVTVYDKNDNLIGVSAGISAPASQGGAFLGIIVDNTDSIGRINVYDTNPGFDAEGLYTLGVYVSGPCPWDLDGNNDVGVGDLLILLAAWGVCDDPANCPADFDNTNVVGVADLLTLLANWGPCP